MTNVFIHQRHHSTQLPLQIEHREEPSQSPIHLIPAHCDCGWAAALLASNQNLSKLQREKTTPGQNSTEREEEEEKERERETGRKRKEKLRENNKVLQLHSLKRRKELILLFCPHVRVSQEVVRHLKYVKTRFARFSSSFIIISVLSVELWDVLFLQDFQYSKVSNWKSEHSTFL